VAFQSSEAITVKDGLIWRVNEYATLVRQHGKAARQRPAPGHQPPGPVAAAAVDHGPGPGALLPSPAPLPGPRADLQQVADASGYSRNQISYLLNQVLGQSFYRYVNQARLQHLMASLDDDSVEAPIDELAFNAGFNSLSAFYKCFREHTGLSPKAYLKQISLRART
jgi:AraC-like DNA-binding protein